MNPSLSFIPNIFFILNIFCFQDGGHTLSDLSNATSSVTSSGSLQQHPPGPGGYGEHQQQQPDQQGVAVGESGGQVPVDLRVGGQQPPPQQRAPVNGHLSGLQHSAESKHPFSF